MRGCVALLAVSLPLLGLVTFTGGCHRLTHQIAITKAVIPQLTKTEQITVPTPERDSLTLNYLVSGARLQVTATRHVACEDREVRTFKRKELIKRKLPKRHWVLFASGLAFGGAGAGFLADGINKLEAGANIDIGTPEQEMKYDLGKIYMPVGVALIALGTSFLISEIVDAASARDRVNVLSDTKEIVVLANRTCSQEAVGNLSFWIQSSDGQKIGFLTNEGGKVVIDLVSGTLWTLPYAEPFAKLMCDNCAPVDLTLPVESSALLVALRRRLNEVDRWLAVHGHSAAAPSIESVRADLLRSEIAGLLQQASKSLQETKYDEFQRTVDEARRLLTLLGGTADPDGGLRSRIDDTVNEAVTDLFLRAKSAVRTKDYRTSSANIKWCLMFSPGNKQCKGLRNQIMAKPVYDEVFFAAVIDNQVSLVKEMLADRPFIVNGVAPFGLGSVVALDIAAMQNFLEMARVLIENGADVEGNRKNKSSVPPLLSALASKHADMAMFLISAGANIKARAPGGMTALHWAVVIPDTYLVERLLSMGAKVDPTNLDGMTPLHFAAANGYTASVRVLVANGADTSATVKGRTALELAAERGHWDVVQVLRNHERNQK